MGTGLCCPCDETPAGPRHSWDRPIPHCFSIQKQVPEWGQLSAREKGGQSNGYHAWFPEPLTGDELGRKWPARMVGDGDKAKRVKDEFHVFLFPLNTCIFSFRKQSQ